MRLRPVLLLVSLAACGPHSVLRVDGVGRGGVSSPRATPAAAPDLPLTEQSARALPRAPFDPSGVHLVMDDPRLAAARTLESASKYLDAARAIDAAITPDLDPSLAARWEYRSAMMRLRGGDPKGATGHFQRAATFDGPLRPYALLEAAETLLALEDPTDAVSALSAIDSHAVPAQRLGTARARALVRSGQYEDGFAEYRLLLAVHEKTWPAQNLEFARALLAHPAPERSLEAARLAREVTLDAPTAYEADAKKTLTDAEMGLAAKDRAPFETPVGTDLVATAERLTKSGRAKRALALLEHVRPDKDLACAYLAARARALAAVGRYSEASRAFSSALDGCEASSDLLFDAGSAAEKGGDPTLAEARFSEVESRFSTSTQAVDARVARARIALANGDAGTFHSLLATIADDYPQRDAAADGLFLLALELMKKGAWKEALPVLQRAAALPRERSYQRAGRASYFLGRALVATAQREDGAKELARTIADFPLTYYAALAYARLELLQRGSGDDALAAAVARPSPPPIGPPDDDVLASPAFRAAVALAGEDDPDGVTSALDALGVVERTAPPEVTLAGAELLGATSKPWRAHQLLRTAAEYEPRLGRKEVYAFHDAYPVGPYRAAWELAYPRPFGSAVERACAESGVAPSLLYALAREESAFLPDAVSKAGAIGLTQVMPYTARSAARRLGLATDDAAFRDPDENLRLGAHFLKQMENAFPEDGLLAIPAYNAGQRSPEKWMGERPQMPFDLFVEDIPFAETRAYTKRVIGSLAAYELLYGKPTLPLAELTYVLP